MMINILVVDDRPEGLIAVEAVLNSPSYNLVLASSGVEALRYLLNYDFAVILMDVQMPELNGFETAEIIKTREKSKDVPIIFMSAISQDEKYVYQGYEVGAIDYILKPFDPYILKSKVALFVELYMKNIQLLQQAKKIHENEILAYSQAMDVLELESMRKYQYLADSIPQIVFRFLPDGNHEYFNRVWFQYTGFSLERSQGTGWKDAIHPDDLLKVFSSINDNSEVEVECRILTSTGEYRWNLVQFGPERYKNNFQIDAWLGTATDIEERKRNESFQRLLAVAGEVLVSSLDFTETFQKVAEHATEEISEFCRIEMLGHSGQFETMAVSQISGKSYPELSSVDFLENGNSYLEAEHFFPELGTCSLIIVPILGKGKIVGAITLLFNELKHKYTESHLKTAEELGRRMGMAYENSTLYDLSQKAIEVRNDFLSIASHELNTPMTSLKLQLQMVKKILESNDSNAMNRFPRSINSSLMQVDRLIGLIHVLLDVSKIQSGKFHLSGSHTSVSEIVSGIMEGNKQLLTTEGCQLQVSNIPNVPVFWDKLRIEQVIINLLMNAIKYAPGKIELNVFEEMGNIQIEVRDFGKGIPKEKIETIFDRFSRATSESVAGMGLGLYIVKEIIEGHNGEIDVSSSHEGTIFRVVLPAAGILPLLSPETGTSVLV